MRRKVAVVIGINDYPGTNADLAGCVNDALDFAGLLKFKGYTVHMLLDQHATKAAVVHSLRTGLASCGIGDRFVFTFSGHGTWIPDRDGDEVDRRDEALCLYDYQTGGLLVDDELHRILQGRRYGTRATIISDSCHSGTMTRTAAVMDRNVWLGDRARFLSPAEFLDDMTYEQAIEVEESTRNGRSRPGAVLISGCADHEYSYDARFAGRPNGAMSYHLIQSLKEDVALRRAGSTRQVFDRLRTKLPSMVYPQTPQLAASRYQERLPLF